MSKSQIAESDPASDLLERLGNWRWRINNLYTIVDENGVRIPFRPNDKQQELLDNIHGLQLILKARQLGFSTLIAILALDQAFWNKDFAAAIIAHGLEPAEKIFRTKIKFALDNLPAEIRAMNPTVKETQTELVFASGSSVYVGTSTRSGTLQLLHISEYGKICRRYPDKASEIKTGSLPSVHQSGLVFIESTAEGTSGHFFDLVMEAKKRVFGKEHAGEFRLHFFPWWRKASYRTAAAGIDIPNETIEYFNELEAKHQIFVDDDQVAWYEIKRRLLGNAAMRQEYPSTVDEAFAAAQEERFFGEQMDLARKEGRIRQLPVMSGRPVNVFLDIGRDTTAVWFHQYAALEHRFIDYIAEVGKLLDYMCAQIAAKGYVINNIYLPHDARDESVVTSTTAEAVVKRMFQNATVHVVDRIKAKYMAIDAARAKLQESWFHETKCAEGIKGLENYRKRWNDTIGNWSEEPVHDFASHPADAYMEFAQGWSPEHEHGGAKKPVKKTQSWAPLDAETGY